MMPSSSVTKSAVKRAVKDQTFLDEAARWQQALQAQGFRGLVHISGSEAWGLQQAEKLIAKLANTASLAFSDDHIAVLNRDAPTTINKAKTLLGQQFSAVLVNGYQGLHANAIALAAGTIKAGGLLMIVSPRHDDWLQFNDPDLQRFITPADNSQPQSSRFIQRFIALLEAIEHFHFDEVDGLSSPIIIEPPNKPENTARFAQQQQAITAIKRVCAGHAKRPLVLLADRGRGKSAALGIAAAELMREKPRRIIITAPRKDVLHSFYAHLDDCLGSDGLAVSSTCQFVAVDELYLHADKYPCDVLLIDEAAAIPSHILAKLTEHYNRLVFSTTTQGYEGNGQGFIIRFAKVLDDLMPQWRSFQLNQALRYSNADPLETWLNQVFLLAHNQLNYAESSQPLPSHSSSAAIHYEFVMQQQLVGDENLLQQLFYLLVTAHYQTSPDDLRALLDQPNICIAYASRNDEIIGVAIAVHEGGFDNQQQEQLLHQQRRFSGHILPQQLLMQLGGAALKLSYLRIMRIATKPLLRREGIGRGLLVFIEEYAKKDSVDMLGSSFSASEDVMDFWSSCGFSAVQLGHKLSAVSASYSQLVLKPLNDNTALMVQQARDVFAADLAYRLQSEYQQLEAGIVARLCHKLSVSYLANDELLLERYTKQQLSIIDCQAALARVALHYYSVQSLATKPSLQDEVVIRRLLLNQSIDMIATALNLTGRKQIEQHLRQWASERISH